MICRLPRLGLAGGLDRDGSHAAELLASGFGSVEFGTATPQAQPGCQASVVLLAQRLAALGLHPPLVRQDKHPCGDNQRGKAADDGAIATAHNTATCFEPTATPDTALIGIGLGLGQGAAPAELSAHWLAGLQVAAPVADYLSFNLSAAANRPLLVPQHAPHLAAALAAVANQRAQMAAGGQRRVALALKLPLDGLPLSTPAKLALAVGFDALILVLPPRPERLNWLQAWARYVDASAQLVAVGGIRCNKDVQDTLNAGASGIQVHTVFVEQGRGCLASLLGGLSCASADVRAAAGADIGTDIDLDASMSARTNLGS